MPQMKDKGTGLRFEAKRKEPWTMVTIFFEPAELGNDPKAYRSYYRKKSFKAAPLEREDIRESERDGMPVLEYTHISGKFRFRNINGFLVRDGLWIDIHASAKDDELASKTFERLLRSARLGESPPR